MALKAVHVLDVPTLDQLQDNAAALPLHSSGYSLQMNHHYLSFFPFLFLKIYIYIYILYEEIRIQDINHQYLYFLMKIFYFCFEIINRSG